MDKYNLLKLIPSGLRSGLEKVVGSKTEEIRLRCGFAPTVLINGSEQQAGTVPVGVRDLHSILEAATGASMHSAEGGMKNGFITISGGIRIGICGTVIMKSGACAGYSAVSSLAIRIPHEIKGVCSAVVSDIDGFSALIISPPGAGKTTLLRDLVRVFSDGDENLGIKSRRVGIADERSEIAALHGGIPQLYVGRRTDIIDGCPKAEALMKLVRLMNPELAALDEITSPEDISALIRACHTGVKIIATAHADSYEDLMLKPLYRSLLNSAVFEKLVTITSDKFERRFAVTVINQDMPQ